MEKKNTVLLTVIAIATLLVAVVGATFAYFASNSSNNTATTITTEVAGAADVFTASGATQLNLNVDNSNMATTEVTKVADSANADLSLVLTAGSGTATCTYDIVWTPNTTDPYTAYQASANRGDNLEYSLVVKEGETVVFAETNIDKIANNVLYSGTISSTEGATVTKTYNVAATFYNLNVDQPGLFGKKYSGTVEIANVVCKNGETTIYESNN